MSNTKRISAPNRNGAGVVLGSAARTASTTVDLVNDSARGVVVVIDVTAKTGSASITIKIQGKDPASGKFYDILASSALSSTGTTTLKVYPGLAVTSNVSANDVLPLYWRVAVSHGNSDSITYSIGANPIV